MYGRQKKLVLEDGEGNEFDPKSVGVAARGEAKRLGRRPTRDDIDRIKRDLVKKRRHNVV